MKFELPTSIRDYFSEAILELGRGRVEVVLHPGEELGDSRGWYSTGELHVAVGGPYELWLPVFVHEFQHFRQDKSAASVWRRSHDASFLGPQFKDCNCQGLFDLVYVQRSRRKFLKSLTETQLYDVVSRVVELERDCELRTLHEIETCRLPVDVKLFRRDAFRCLAEYAVAYHKGQYKPGEAKDIRSFPEDFSTIDFFDWAASPANQKLWRYE